tara:strand:- start:211 stop:636 length:426 start_codon:yes stop_codon:yes gene_type:complete
MVQVINNDGIKSYNSKEVIEETCHELKGLKKDFKEWSLNEIKKNNESEHTYWNNIFYAQDFLKFVTGHEYNTDNTYNHDSSLNNVLQYAIPKNVFDHKCRIIAIEEHLGGDVRGNYDDIKFYICHDIELFFHYQFDEELNQ